MKAIILLTGIFLNLTAEAHTKTCLVADYTLTSRQIYSVDKCRIVQDLKIYRAGRFAQWVGLIEKPYKELETYNKIISNRCTHAIEYRGKEVRITDNSLRFSMPTLVDEFQMPSYEMTPFTDVEAKQIFDDLLEECRNATPHVDEGVRNPDTTRTHDIWFRAH